MPSWFISNAPKNNNKNQEEEREKKKKKKKEEEKNTHFVLSVLSDLTHLLHACTCRGQTSNLP